MPSHLEVLRGAALVDLAKNKKRAERLVADVKERSTRIAEEAHAVGKALAELSDERNYAALGYGSFAALLKGEKLMGRTTAHKLISISEAYSLEQVRAMGVEKAYALLSFVDATPKLDVASVLFENNARIGNKYVAKMTVREIDEAAKRVRKASGRAKPQSNQEKLARSQARKLQARLRKQGFARAKASAVRDENRWHVQVIVDTHDAGQLA